MIETAPTRIKQYSYGTDPKRSVPIANQGPLLAKLGQQLPYDCSVRQSGVAFEQLKDSIGKDLHSEPAETQDNGGGDKQTGTHAVKASGSQSEQRRKDQESNGDRQQCLRRVREQKEHRGDNAGHGSPERPPHHRI